MENTDNNSNRKRRSTFAVLFYLNRSKMKKDGLCPVLGRITIDTGISQFSAKINADPGCWDAKAGRATGRSRQANEVNKVIDVLAGKVKGYYDEILDEQGYVTAELVKNALYGIGRKSKGLLELFREHNGEFKLRVGVNRVHATYEHYQYSYRYLCEFIRQKYDAEDVPLRSLRRAFIDAYDMFLRVDKQMTQHTISGHLINLKKIVRRAVSQGTLKCDPFYTFIPEQPERKCRHLKAEEIDRIMQVHISSPQVCHTRDIFIFSCFTGLSYMDLCNLSEKHLHAATDGNQWICINRQKTGTESNIRLLDIARQIIEKYRPARRSDKIFNTVSLSCVCNNLRKIEQLCAIEHITFHMARHNFGTHITLSQGVPIETVSRMMGHSSITTTQIYAKITDQKVNEDMKRLSGDISDRYNIFEDKTMPVGIKLNQNFKRIE